MRFAKQLSVGLAVIAIFAVVGFVFRYDIHDWVKLRGYTPSSEIEALADDTAMEAYAKRLFYVNRPVIADKDTFNTHCRHNEHSIVLGCYMPGQQGIYLLNVSDERLSGIKEVTAAHEMLHAAYERLSSSERQRIDELLQSTYDEIKDTRIRETVEQYRKQDPSIVLNELHSILGTEVSTLPTELESYYAKYFSDRTKVVRYAEQYEHAFIERRSKVRQMDAELAALKADIDAVSQEIAEEDTRLKNMRNQMNSYRTGGQTDAYNQLVPEYNSQVAAFNGHIDDVGAQIIRYNALVQERNDIASEQAELVQAIDSREILPTER